MAKLTKYKGLKVREFIRDARHREVQYVVIAEELSELARKSPLDYAYGTTASWSVGKVQRYVARFLSDMVAPRATNQLAFRDIEVPEPTEERSKKSDSYIFVAVPQHKLATVMEVLR